MAASSKTIPRGNHSTHVCQLRWRWPVGLLAYAFLLDQYLMQSNTHGEQISFLSRVHLLWRPSCSFSPPSPPACTMHFILLFLFLSFSLCILQCFYIVVESVCVCVLYCFIDYALIESPSYSLVFYCLIPKGFSFIPYFTLLKDWSSTFLSLLYHYSFQHY